MELIDRAGQVWIENSEDNTIDPSSIKLLIPKFTMFDEREVILIISSHKSKDHLYVTLSSNMEEFAIDENTLNGFFRII